MNKDVSRTPNVNFDLNTGPQANIQDEAVIGRRIIAYIIDVCILGVIGFVLTIFNFMTLGLMSPLLVLATIVLPIAYHSYFISSHHQATIGQKFMGLKQINAITGERMSWLQAVVQVVLFYMTLGMTSGLLLIWCLFDNKGRCLHDILSNTHVVSER